MSENINASITSLVDYVVEMRQCNYFLNYSHAVTVLF